MDYTKAEMEDFFAYLDDLRASGETNMFAAAPYLEGEYALDGRESKKILSVWMDTYSGNTSIAERATAAMAALS